MAEDRTEHTFQAAERLVDDDLVALVTESAQQNTDLDMCGARHAVMARNIAEDVLEHLLNTGWLPPDEAGPLLALAEQQQEEERPTPLIARTWLAKQLHNAGACEPGGEEDGQVVCDENCKSIARMAQDVFLGGPIDWTKEESDV